MNFSQDVACLEGETGASGVLAHYIKRGRESLESYPMPTLT